MYQKMGKIAYKPGLERIEHMLRYLGNPEQHLQHIHVGGTNGKGSVSHMLSSVLQEAGYKVGLYTSPHLIDFRERIKINGQMIPKKWVSHFVKKNKQLIENSDPSFFEVSVAMAFEYFRIQKVDICVIEVGLGGRLDSTNVITPCLSIITNISYDHMDLLGDTLPKIAAEKAGIIKKNTPIVVGERSLETEQVFKQYAQALKADLVFASDQKITIPQSDLQGLFQKKNRQTSIVSVEILQKQGFKISANHLKNGLAEVVNNTGLHGRWHKIAKKPLVYCDTGHNQAGIQEVLLNIKNTPHHLLHWVFGMVNDKDSAKILALLPKNATYYFCKPSVPRGKEADLLHQEAKKFDLTGLVYKDVKSAFKSALKNAKTNDLILIGGSTFVVADFLSFYRR